MKELKGVIMSEEQWYYVLDLLENRRDEVEEDSDKEFEMASSCIKNILSSLISAMDKKPFPEV